MTTVNNQPKETYERQKGNQGADQRCRFGACGRRCRLQLEFDGRKQPNQLQSILERLSRLFLEQLHRVEQPELTNAVCLRLVHPATLKFFLSRSELVTSASSLR